MPVWLVTGGTGFLGRHFFEALRLLPRPGVEVVVLGRNELLGSGWARFVAADLTDPDVTARAVSAIAPEVVFHLAGLTPPNSPAAFYQCNTLATIHLLDALRAVGAPVRVVMTGSAAEFGPLAPADLPVAEDFVCRPAGSYGLSKLLATTAGLAARPPLEVVVARIFNPIGPGLPTSQAFGRFAARLSEPGPDPMRLVVGDLESRRDFVDVRDVARALLILAEEGRAGRLYHVGSGQSYRVGDGLDHLIRSSGRAVRVEADSELLARRGPSDARADIGRILAETSWRPETPWEQSLADLWQEARRGRS